MCHQPHSRPPAPPHVVPTDDHGPVVLRTSAGTVSPSYAAHPANPGRRGVVILPDVRGAHAYYRDLAVRFAEAGVHAVVVDYYGHLTDDMERGDEFEWQSRLPDVTTESVADVVTAAVAHLHAAGVRSLFSVGFCFGGSQSWLLSATDLPFDGVIGCYGNPDLVSPVVDELHKPMLLLVAGADVATTLQRSQEFEAELSAAGVPHEQHVYADAPHSFFDRAADEWTAASADAWQRMLAFMAEHSRATDTEDARARTYRRLGEFLPALPELARRFAHTEIAGRPGLDTQSRELVVLGALVALGDTGLQLTAHARAALAAGITVEQLGEIVLQTIPYAGFPRAINAALALAELLDGSAA